MKRAFLFAGAVAFMAVAAMAQTNVAVDPDSVVVDPTVVSVPLAAWVKALADFAIPIVLGLYALLLKGPLAQWAAVAQIFRLDQLLENAIKSGINAAAGAVPDKPLTIDVGSVVVANALNYAIKHGPGWLIAWAGGIEGIREKIIARLPFAESEAASIDAVRIMSRSVTGGSDIPSFVGAAGYPAR